MYRDAVLLSVKPKWCELIASGAKTVEIRKTKPRIDVPFTCYIYCTLGSGISDMLWTGKDCTVGKLSDASNGKLIGEFECDRIDAFKVFENEAVQNWNFFDLVKSCLTYDEAARYIGRGKTGYAWHISKLIVYPKPMELSTLNRCRRCKYYNTCDEAELSCSMEHMIINPPMSWCYCGPI